jgi:hypothetical protein
VVISIDIQFPRSVLSFTSILGKLEDGVVRVGTVVNVQKQLSYADAGSVIILRLHCWVL